MRLLHRSRPLGSASGLFPAPSGLGSAIERQHGVESLGILKDAEVAYYAVTVERRIEHRGVLAICAVQT